MELSKAFLTSDIVHIVAGTYLKVEEGRVQMTYEYNGAAFLIEKISDLYERPNLPNPDKPNFCSTMTRYELQIYRNGAGISSSISGNISNNN